MNIYITVELALRELDSKLLLAVLAAQRASSYSFRTEHN